MNHISGFFDSVALLNVCIVKYNFDPNFAIRLDVRNDSSVCKTETDYLPNSLSTKNA